jgi:2-C-methyl-D-erythritol 4-phosphate cytidylyltransferase
MEWTLGAFDLLEGLGEQVIAVQPSDTKAQEILASFPGVQAVVGGEERSDSVLNALYALRQTEKLSDWVLVHDIARPCVDPADIQNLVHYCTQHEKGAVLARRITDTVKQVQGNGWIKTIDRSHLWTVQTPQCFRLGELIDALEFCRERDIAITDEASAMEAYGAETSLVEGSERNIKLTHPADKALLEFYIQQVNKQ